MAPGWSMAGLLAFLGLVGGALGSSALRTQAGSDAAADEPGSEPSPGEIHHNELGAEPAHGHVHAADWGLVPVGLDVDQPPELRHEPPFSLETGKIPTLSEARAFAHKYSRFVAKGNEGLDTLRREGHFAGNGTPASPYVLDRFLVDGDLVIESTNRSLLLRNGYVTGQLRLNYVGTSLYVHHVHAKDLRVNENVKRSGPNTGGLFHDDAFGFVGQIRHFVGEFRDNTIGPKPQGVVQSYLGDAGVAQVPEGVVFNFDGFHTADVHHNVFEGMVEIKLHGHNHADCLTCPVHDHSDRSGFPSEDPALAASDAEHGMRSHHSVRYVSLAFHDNEVRVHDGLALRYNDRNHAGDDRTANSEPNPYLEDPHVHYQDVSIVRNRLEGGGLQVDGFNAADERHPLQNRGILRLWENEVDVAYAPADATARAAPVFAGVQVRQADGLELSVRGNKVRFVDASGEDPGASFDRALGPGADLRGFQLESVSDSNLTLAQNEVPEGTYGVYAMKLAKTVHWWLRANSFGTREAWRGSQVGEAPEES